MQVRSDAKQQRKSLLNLFDTADLQREQFTVWNVFKNPHIDSALADEHDALFIGGSSDDPEDTVSFDADRFPFIVDAKEMIRYCIDHGIPTFASCIGFQIAVEVLGGEVIFDKVHMEMGTYPIHLTDAGKADPLFQSTSDGFLAVSGHKKRAAAVPEGCEFLAYSDLCPIHAIKVQESHFMVFSFIRKWTRRIWLLVCRDISVAILLTKHRWRH